MECLDVLLEPVVVTFRDMYASYIFLYILCYIERRQEEIHKTRGETKGRKRKGKCGEEGKGNPQEGGA